MELSIIGARQHRTRDGCEAQGHRDAVTRPKARLGWQEQPRPRYWQRPGRRFRHKTRDHDPLRVRIGGDDLVDARLIAAIGRADEHLRGSQRGMQREQAEADPDDETVGQ